jgi:hypothetical protein
VREQRIQTAPPDPSDSLLDPIYFLYFHTVELALEAFIRAHRREIIGTFLETHNLPKLYEECRTLGLVIGTGGQFEIGVLQSFVWVGEGRYDGAESVRKEAWRQCATPNCTGSCWAWHRRGR